MKLMRIPHANLTDNNWSPRLNLYYPSKDGGVTLFGLIVASFIASLNIMNIIQATTMKDAHQT